MPHPRWFRSSRWILAVFLGTMCCLGAALTWLCWRLLDQDRQIEVQRAQERLEQAAERTQSVFAAIFQDFDSWLPPKSDAPKQSPPRGLILLLKTDAGVSIWPTSRIAYLPTSPSSGPNLDAVFAAGERLEFQNNDPAAAAEIFRTLTASRDPDVRAGALLRLGRNLRKLGRNQEALATYAQLADMKTVAIESVPAELIALGARCRVFEAAGRHTELQKEALLIDSGLRNRRWQLPGAAWEFHRAEASRWANIPALTEGERRALAVSHAAEWALQLWPRPLEPHGRRWLNTESGPVLVSWSADQSRLAAVLASPDRVQSIWNSAQLDPGVHTALVDANGNIVVGSVAPRGLRAIRSPAVPGMAAALLLTRADSASDLANAALRRRFLLAGFTLLALVLTGGSYFMVRFMARESAVARMQAEFVSTVSHEFRTPLTSIRQLSEMLVRDRIPTETERRESYDVLFRASERLERLVESLLDFGRMEAATFRYRFDELDVRALVSDTVKAFQEQAANGHEVALQQDADLPPVHGDRDALSVAVWNLLDNAAKYSPERRTVWVETKREDSGIAIEVRDQGAGIEKNEQARIFEKFVRGSAALKSNIKGTGIGLSMARHIARAHGGDIRLASEPGRGSTFTLFIPSERRS